MLTLLLFAFALSSDAFAVAMARGASKHKTWAAALLTATVFSLFEGGMTFVGWHIGSLFHNAFESWGRFVVAMMLVLLGAKMFWDARRLHTSPNISLKPTSPVLALTGLLMAAFAISLDAAACGAALPYMGLSLCLDIIVISGMTFVLSLLGYRLGGVAGERLGSIAEQAGGIILILLSIKVIFI